MRSLVLFGLLLGALLIPGRLQAAPRIEVVAPRSGFTLSRVMVSFAIDLRERDDRASAAVMRYRVHIADREGGRGWDSGWLAAPPRERDGRLRLHVNCGLDTTGAAAVSEMHVVVALEVAGVMHEPWRFTFFPWADGRFRPFPEPQPWPEPIRAPELELDIVHAPPATKTIAPRATARQPMIIVIRPSAPPRVSWGHLKSTYR